MKKFNINLDDSAFTKERTQLKPHFQPTCKGQQDPTASGGPSGDHLPKLVQHPLSYAEYIVQSKSSVVNVTKTVPSRELSHSLNQVEPPHSTSSSTTTTNKDNEKEATVPSRDLEKNKELPVNDESCQKSDQSLIPGPKPVGSGSSIIVSPRQRGNPILKFVRSVPWEFGEIVPDYVLGQTTCALFLSLRYHNLNPNYIHDRLKTLGNSFTLRVLLVQVDVKDPHHALKELARICVMADCTLILAWSPEEAGRYLETYKSYEKKPADLLKEQVEKDYLSKVTDCLTTVKSINKTDAITLLSTFSSVEGIISASKEELVLCPGLGPQKARRLYDVLHTPFLMSKSKDS